MSVAQDPDLAARAKCPICEYDLRGVDVCPECGASAEDRADFTRRVRAYGRFATVLLVLTLLSAPAVMVFRWLQFLRPPTGSSYFVCLGPFLILPILGWLVVVPIMFFRDRAARRSVLPLAAFLAMLVAIVEAVILFF